MKINEMTNAAATIPTPTNVMISIPSITLHITRLKQNILHVMIYIRVIYIMIIWADIPIRKI